MSTLSTVPVALGDDVRDPARRRRFTPLAVWLVGRRIAFPVVAACLMLLAWQIVVPLAHISPLIIVPPSVVGRALVQDWPVLVEQAIPTLIDTVVGFLLASCLGMALGGVVVLSHRVHQALNPHVIFFQLIPKVALAPLFIVWLGVGPASRLAFAVFLGFFPMVVATSAGLLSAERNALRLCRSAGASRLQTFVNVRLPYAVPHMFAGLKVAVTMAMIGVIVGEFVTAQQGLGYIIMFASSAGETAVVFAAIALLCAIGLVLYGMIGAAEWVVVRQLGVTITSAEF